MPSMHPRQAVKIVQNLLKERARNPRNIPLRSLSPKQVQGITLLAHFVDKANRARDALRAIDRLFDAGLTYAGHSHLRPYEANCSRTTRAEQLCRQ